MSARMAAAPAFQPERAGLYVPADGLAAAFVWLTVATGAFVFFEPAPFDAFAVALIFFLPLLRATRFTSSLVLFLGVWLVIAATALVAATMAEAMAEAVKHTMITLYLSLAAAVLAAFVAGRPERHGRVVLSAYGLGAVLAASAGIVGYLGLVPGGYDLFTEFGRARGTFKDPNVYGAFLTPAILYALHNMMTRPPIRALLSLAVLPILVLGLLVSFSRGAWGNLAIALIAFAYLTFVTASTVRRQLALIVVGMAGLAMTLGVLIAALQDPNLADFLRERLTLTQGYDIESGGRFAGQLKALDYILENPLGIGGLQFGLFLHPEDVHNVYLSMFLNSGWLGGGLYATIVIVTVLAGFVHVLRDTPSRGIFIVAYASFIGVAAEGVLVDTDHWRHFFLLLALNWGLMAAGRPMPAPDIPATQRMAEMARAAADRRATACIDDPPTDTSTGTDPVSRLRRRPAAAEWAARREALMRKWHQATTARRQLVRTNATGTGRRMKVLRDAARARPTEARLRRTALARRLPHAGIRAPHRNS